MQIQSWISGIYMRRDEYVDRSGRARPQIKVSVVETVLRLGLAPGLAPPDGLSVGSPISAVITIRQWSDGPGGYAYTVQAFGPPAGYLPVGDGRLAASAQQGGVGGGR